MFSYEIMAGDNLQSSPGYMLKLFMSRRPHAFLIAASASGPRSLPPRLQKRGGKEGENAKVSKLEIHFCQPPQKEGENAQVSKMESIFVN